MDTSDAVEPALPLLSELMKTKRETGEHRSDISDRLKAIACSSPQMTSSVASIQEDDTTPSDSGVQLLDSESSELNESLMSNSGFEFDCCVADIKVKPNPDNIELPSGNPLTKSDIDNSNSVCVVSPDENPCPVPAELVSSTCSTFDGDNIVYRRRAKKNKNGGQATAPKKRVSFHEDILKNSKTDNIHIEHGFITYKNYPRKNYPIMGRYSWCSEGDKGPAMHYQNHDESSDVQCESRCVYRNACSDVLDYGMTDIYDTANTNYVVYDNSGVYEYAPQVKGGCSQQQSELYKCSCSSSNSSLDSESGNSDESNGNPKATVKQNYTQSKSSSYDCIGGNAINNNNVPIGDNCYYSEPNIGNIEEDAPKSVWNKEKKPKSSCLKKSKRHTNIVHEQDITSKIKKFNVHQLPDMNNLIGNSKMIFGSLKNIFSMPLPERGVPEGQEDSQSVYECIPDNENSPSAISKCPLSQKKTVTSKTTTGHTKSRTFLSKSLDGGIHAKHASARTFVHNVDEQLRRKNDDDLFASSNNSSEENSANSSNSCEPNTDEQNKKEEQPSSVSEVQERPEMDFQKNYRNKFIINCESTVFEHTGVSYCYGDTPVSKAEQGDDSPTVEISESVITLTSNQQTINPIISVPLKQKISNMFKSFTTDVADNTKSVDESCLAIGSESFRKNSLRNLMETSVSSSHSDRNSTISDITFGTVSSTTATPDHFERAITEETPKNNRHLSSPMHKKATITRIERPLRMSPDLFNGYGRQSRVSVTSPAHQAQQQHHLLSDEFDDILTITTTSDNDKTLESDIVILDYPETRLDVSSGTGMQYLRPSSASSSSKTSLINRFLRNVTQKKLLDASIKRNHFFLTKLNNERRICENIYVKSVKPTNRELIDELNAEIAMEIEQSTSDEPSVSMSERLAVRPRMDEGVGEVPVDYFNGNCLEILRNQNEILMKVFKLYTGYSREGAMTPVLVFLTDKTLYVINLDHERVSNKFVLPYSDLDVILMSPYGNTVLLSNSVRDMQQVLLAGGPYPADGLVASLEMCARRGGTTLPAVGQLTLDHFAPLQGFVRDNASVTKSDRWMYYAIVNVPRGALNNEREPLGPNMRGPLMHRSIHGPRTNQLWHAGYFLLKAGVLYIFQDSIQKLPSSAIVLTECQGARRAMTVGRPHCFEIMLRTYVLQLAAPDEYVASEWLQALVQSASKVFDIHDKNMTVGCSLVMTTNHLITLREDFNAPLRRVNVNKITEITQMKENFDPNKLRKHNFQSVVDNVSEVSSSSSTPSLTSACNSGHSLTSMSLRNRMEIGAPNVDSEKSYSTMSGLYGKNSGVEILTCAAIKEMVTIKIPKADNTWWCILEFSCQEVRENSDDLVVFFATNSEMIRFLSMLEDFWTLKNEEKFPIEVLADDCLDSMNCCKLFDDLNKSWEPLLTAALGYPRTQ